MSKFEKFYKSKLYKMSKEKMDFLQRELEAQLTDIERGWTANDGYYEQPEVVKAKLGWIEEVRLMRS